MAALLLIVFLFPDVIFLGASLAPLDYDQALSIDRPPAAPVSLYPESINRNIVDSWGDIGAASWQFQSAVSFMAYSMRARESPWWDPYQAAGRMGRKVWAMFSFPS